MLCYYSTNRTPKSIKFQVAKLWNSLPYSLKQLLYRKFQRWSRGHKARGQGHKKNPRRRPRPRTDFSRTDLLEETDRNARGKGKGPRTQAQVFSKNKGLQNFFSGDLKKMKIKNKGLPKYSARFLPYSKVTWKEGHGQGRFLMNEKSAVLEPKTGQFSTTRDFEAKDKDLTFEA